MKRIGLIAPYKIDDEGKLYADWGYFDSSTIEFLGEYYDLTIILRRIRDKEYEQIPVGVRVLYDEECPQCQNSAAAGVMESQYFGWKNVHRFQEKWDCVILLHAFSAWGIACALNRMEAARKLVYVQKKASEYIVPEERAFFRRVFNCFDDVVCALPCVSADFKELYSMRGNAKTAYCVPNAASYLKQNQMDAKNLFDSQKLTLVTRENLVTWNSAERIPALVEQLKEWYPQIQWYLIGESERMAHLLKEIVIRDVCEEVFPVGNVEKPYLYMRWCNGVVVFDENDRETELSAQVLGVPVKRMEPSEGVDELRQWLDTIGNHLLSPASGSIWPDWETWQTCIEGGSQNEN